MIIIVRILQTLFTNIQLMYLVWWFCVLSIEREGSIFFSTVFAVSYCETFGWFDSVCLDWL